MMKRKVRLSMISIFGLCFLMAMYGCDGGGGDNPPAPTFVASTAPDLDNRTFEFTDGAAFDATLANQAVTLQFGQFDAANTAQFVLQSGDLMAMGIVSLQSPLTLRFLQVDPGLPFTVDQQINFDATVDDNGRLALENGQTSVSSTSGSPTQMVPDTGIQGLVTANDTGAPVEALAVLAFNFDSRAFIIRALTTATGSYFLEVPPGRYHLVSLGTGQLATQWSGGAANSVAAVPVIVSAITDNVNFALNAGGALTGQVTGPDGTSIAGQVVVFFNAATGNFVAVDRTEADGRFSRGLAPDRYKVRVDGDDRGFATVYFDNAPVTSAATPVEVTLGETTTDVNIQLAQGGRLLGRVTEAATGTPVNDAQILVNLVGRGFVDTASTDADGTYGLSLAPGSYVVRARARGTNLAPQFHDVVGDLMIFSASTPVTVTAGVDTTNIDFSLTVGGTITGRVVSAVDETPIAGVGIRALEFRSVSFVNSIATRFDGTYVLNLPPGDYKLRAAATAAGFATLFFGEINERTRSISVPVEVGSTTSDIDFRLPIGGVISGRVTSAGTGIASVSVCVDNTLGFFIRCINSQFDGSYRLVLQAPHDDYRVYPSPSTSFFDLAQDFRTREFVPLSTPGMEVSNVDFDLNPDAFIVGRVTAADGTPLPRAGMSAFDADTGNFVESDSADFDGRYKLNVPAGDYNLRFFPSQHPLPRQWFQDEGIPVFRRSDASVVTVGPGEESTVDISVAPGGSISGHLSLDDGAPVSAVRVSIFGETTGAFGDARVQADGAYIVYGPPDDYEVRVRSSAELPFVEEFFDNQPDFDSADLVSIADVGSDTANIDFVLAADL